MIGGTPCRRPALDGDGRLWYTPTIMARKLKTVSDVLRQAIIDSGLPYLTLEQATGVKRHTIARFVRRTNSLVLAKADLLAVYLGVRVAPPKRKRG